MMASPVGFSAKGHPKNPLSFVTRMTEQRLLDKSCTNQYSSAASAGVASTAKPNAQIMIFFIRSSKVGAPCGDGTQLKSAKVSGGRRRLGNDAFVLEQGLQLARLKHFADD